jgi:hypothetical protein
MTALILSMSLFRSTSLFRTPHFAFRTGYPSITSFFAMNSWLRDLHLLDLPCPPFFELNEVPQVCSPDNDPIGMPTSPRP